MHMYIYCKDFLPDPVFLCFFVIAFSVCFLFHFALFIVWMQCQKRMKRVGDKRKISGFLLMLSSWTPLILDNGDRKNYLCVIPTNTATQRLKKEKVNTRFPDFYLPFQLLLTENEMNLKRSLTTASDPHPRELINSRT